MKGMYTGRNDWTQDETSGWTGRPGEKVGEEMPSAWYLKLRRSQGNTSTDSLNKTDEFVRMKVSEK